MPNEPEKGYLNMNMKTASNTRNSVRILITAANTQLSSNNHEQWLILYDGDSKYIFAKIPMKGADDQTLELNEDNFLIRLNYVNNLS